MPKDNDNSCNYYEGTNFEVWIGTEPITCDAPTPTQYFTVFAKPVLATNIDARNISTTQVPLPKKIPNGRRLITSAGQVITFNAASYVTDPVSGIKYIPNTTSGEQPGIKPLSSPQIFETPFAIDPTYFYTTITWEDMLPLFSVNDVKYDASWDTIGFQNAGSDDELMARTTRKIAFSLSGHKVKGDTMNALIEKCMDNKHLRLKCLYIDPSNEAREMYLHVTKESASAKIKTPFDVSYDFVYAGGYKRYDLIPS